MVAVKPYHCHDHVLPFWQREQPAVVAVGLSHLSLDPVSVNGMPQTAFRNGNHQLVVGRL